MVRTVRVRLELDRDDYKRGLRDAATETRGFDSEVRSLGKDLHTTGIEVKSAGTQVEAMGREVDAAAKKTAGLGDEAAKAKAKTTGLGEESKRTRQNIVDLGADIIKTKTALKDMGEEFQRTGKVNVDELNKLSNGLRDLERAKAALGKLIPGADQKDKGGLLDFGDWIVQAGRAGAEAGKLFSSGLQGGLSTPVLGPIIGTALVGAIVVATPMVTAALAAAVNLGIGGGVLALGISRAVADNRVAAAWSGLGDTATAALDKSSTRFVEPLIRSAHRFEAAFVGDVMPRIDSAFEALAPKLDNLTEGAIGFARNVGPGFDQAVAAAGPFIDLLSEHLPEIGASISSFLGHLNNAGPGAEQFFHDLLTWTEGGIRTIGWLVEKGSEVYQLFTALGLLIQGDFAGAWETWSDGIVALASGADKGEASFGGFHNKTIDVNVALGLLDGTVTRLGDGTLVAAGDFAGLSKMLGETAATADTVAGLMAGKLFDSMMSLDQAALGFAQSQTQVSESIRRNGLELDIHTAKGQTNTGAILGAVQANMSQYQANIAVGMAAGDAAKAYDVNTAALEHQLRQAGFTQGAIDGLIGKYRNVPGKVNTDIATNGLTTAIENLDDLIRRINNIPTRRDIYITEHLSTTGGFSYKSPDRLFDYPAGRHGAITSFAQGGVAPGIYQTMSGPGIFKFAEPEAGPEAYIPRNIDHSRAMGIAAEVGDWHGFDVVPRQAPGYAQFANTRPMGGGGITNITTVTIPVTAGMGTDEYRLGQQIAEAMRPFVAGHGNNVQMAIVGRP